MEVSARLHVRGARYSLRRPVLKALCLARQTCLEQFWGKVLKLVQLRIAPEGGAVNSEKVAILLQLKLYRVFLESRCQVSGVRCQAKGHA